MSDLKNKYSDSRLDPSENAFKDIVNHPDMQAVNDQGDAIVRDDEASKLRNAEENIQTPSRFNEGDGKDAAREAEAKEWNNPENRFGYKPSNKELTKPTTSTRRRNTIRFGIAGGSIGLVLAAFGMLLPLKIPGIMQMISDEAGQRVEQVTERRAKIIIARAIVQKFATSGSGIVVTGNGPVSTLIASMRTNSFEKRLADKGLTIERTNEGVRLSVNGEKLDNGKLLKTDTEVMRALDGHPVTNKIIKDLVKEEIPSWRWMKKAKFAKWLRIKYGIPRYGLENNSNPDEEARIKAVNEARLAPEYEAVAQNMGDAANDLMDGNGDRDPYDPEVSSSGTDSDITNTAREAGAEVASENSDPNNRTTATIIEKLSTKLSSKAIPIVGWIDLAATINHIVYETSENDLIGKISSYYRAMQYSRHFGVWSGYGSQVQLGAMDPVIIGVLAAQTDGVEKSQAFNMIEGNPEAGVPVKNKINANNPTGISENLKEFTLFFGGYEGLGGKTANVILEAWYDVSTAIFAKIGDALGAVAAGITPDAIEEWTAKYLGKAIGKLMALMGLDFDPMVKGADWFNAAHGGATWSYNDFCKVEMGCRKLSSQQALLQNATVAAERASYRQQKGVAYALFSTESSSSLVSQMAVEAPTNIASAASKFGYLITSTPATLLGALTGKTSAAGYTDIHGVDPYGATDQDLNQPVAEQAITGADCPEVAENEYNGCLVDTMVAEAMLCEFNASSESCSDSDSGSDSADSPLVCSAVPTWTNLPASTGAPVGGPVSGTIDMAVANIQKGSGVSSSLNSLTNSKPDFIALNEIGETSLAALEAAAPGYGAYREPKVDGGVGGGQRSMDNAIMWRKDKWTFLEGGRVKVTEDDMGYHSGNPFTWDRWAAWGTFKRTDGAIVSVISTHMMTNPQKFPAQHGNPELTRIQQYKQSMEILIQLTSVLAAHGPVLVGGDMNTHANQGDWSAVPMMKKAGFGYANDGAVVYLFHPQGTKLVSQKNINIASDHPALWAKIDMNGTGPGAITAGSEDCASGAAGTWSLPVEKSAWESDGPRWLESHTEKSDAWTNNLKAGADINIGSTNDDCGKPVYAMLGGTIVSGAPGYTMQIKSQVNGKEVIITYAHGTGMKTSGNVNAGDQIMVIGNKSSYAGMYCHLHLEIKYGDKAICPQKILPTVAAGEQPDLNTVPEATFLCAG